MKKIELLGVDQDIFYEQLESGLKVFVLPFKNKKNYYVSYGTKYGSINLEFKDIETNKMIKTNAGIAHFLEHKMFEQENDVDPFEYFSRTGTGCNASTSYKKTQYYIYGINSLEDNLLYLINCVDKPFFTDENVEKEKGIIKEEIKMYDDNPDWVLIGEMLRATFNKHPIMLDIAGSVDSINKITKEELYKCYNTFYQPSNMSLIVSGNVDPTRIIELVKNNESTKKKITNKEIENKKIDEPIKINKPLKEITVGSVTIPKLGFTIKQSIKNVKDKYKYYVYINTILKILFGSTSLFREKMYKEKYATIIYTETMVLDDYILIQFFSETDKPKELVEKIKEQFKFDITEEELIRNIKVAISVQVIKTDNIEAISDTIFNDLVNWNKIIDNKVEVLKSLNIKDLKQVQDNLNIDNNTTVILGKTI